MWIIPNNLQLSNGAPDTEAFISDLNEQSQICASSLMVRSKPSPARTWSQKWSRDSWTRHLSGRILKPSQHKSFVTEWTCLWPVIPASHSAQQGNDSEQKTLVTSGLTSLDQFELFAPDSVSSRMSKDTSALDSAKSLENWKRSVIKRRGEYSLRVKSAHLTNGSGSLSWPTANARDWKDGSAECNQRAMDAGHQVTLARAATCWPTPTTAEAGKISCCPNYGQLGLSNHPDVHGYQVNRPKKEKSRKDVNWPTATAEYPTPRTTDWKSSANAPSNPVRVEEGTATLGEFIHASGLPAPANPSTDGNHPESLDQSQRNWQTFAHGTHNRGETPHRQVVKALVNGEKAQTQCLTVDQVFAEEIKGTNPNSWATPQASDHIEGARTDLTSNQKCLGRDMKQWATPNAFCYQPPENTEQWTKRAEYQQTEKGVNLHKPVQSQVLHENEKVMGAMPPSAGKLNPRWVETLMGLPIGWTMPSCVSPVTIEPTNCDCLETELSQPPQSEHLELF